MASVMKVMRGTTAGWNDKEAEGTRLGSGQIGYNKDTKELKVGDGTTLFASLPNINAGVDPNIYKSNGIHEPNGEINFYNDTVTSSALLSIKNGNIIPGGGYNLGSDDRMWTDAWVRNIKVNDNLILNAIGANGSDMKQIQLRLMTADEDPAGVRSLIFDQNAFYPYNTTTLGTSTNPWEQLYTNTVNTNAIFCDTSTLTIASNTYSTGKIQLSVQGLGMIVALGGVYPTSSGVSLGTSDNPWPVIYLGADSTRQMAIKWNSDDEAIEFLAE